MYKVVEDVIQKQFSMQFVLWTMVLRYEMKFPCTNIAVPEEFLFDAFRVALKNIWHVMQSGTGSLDKQNGGLFYGI